MLYVFFFPKLLAGPIIKYHDIVGQMEAVRRPSANDAMSGFARFMRGAVKKILLADTLASGADLIFGANTASLSGLDAWWGVLFFTFQIYFDFSGYSDMAIGLARMLGFRLAENFNMPYVAITISDFWRRCARQRPPAQVTVERAFGVRLRSTRSDRVNLQVAASREWATDHRRGA